MRGGQTYEESIVLAKYSGASQRCNPTLIKHLREQRGWSQTELAQRAGYSDRLIRKAEAGLPIAAVTISDLADTFSRMGDRVFPEDLTTHPVRLAENYLAAFHECGPDWVDAIRETLDPKIVMHIAGDPAQIPFAGRHCGIEALKRSAKIFFSVLEVPAGHDHRPHYRFLGRGNEVTMTGESWLQPIGQPPVQQPVQVWHRFLFRRGKIVLIEDLFDTLQAAKNFNPGVAQT